MQSWPDAWRRSQQEGDALLYRSLVRDFFPRPWTQCLDEQHPERLRWVRSVDMQYIRFVTGFDGSRIHPLQAVSLMPNLEHLDCFDWSSDPPPPPLGFGRPKLRSLDIFPRQLDGHGIPDVSSLLRWLDLSELRRLGICYDHTAPYEQLAEQYRFLAELIRLAPASLHTLSIRRIFYSSENEPFDAQPLLNSLARLTNLHTLELPMRLLGNDPFQSALLPALPSVRCLICGNIELAPALSQPHAALETVVLRACAREMDEQPPKVMTERLYDLLLAAAPSRFPSLRTVVVDAAWPAMPHPAFISFDTYVGRCHLRLGNSVSQLRSLGLVVCDPAGVVWREEWDKQYV